MLSSAARAARRPIAVLVSIWDTLVMMLTHLTNTRLKKCLLVALIILCLLYVISLQRPRVVSIYRLDG